MPETTPPEATPADPVERAPYQVAHPAADAEKTDIRCVPQADPKAAVTYHILPREADLQPDTIDVLPLRDGTGAGVTAAQLATILVDVLSNAVQKGPGASVKTRIALQAAKSLQTHLAR